MFKIRKGNTRIVFILFNFLVIKIPNPKLNWHILDFETRKSLIDFLKSIPRNIYGAMLYGIIANISEALIFYAKRGRKKTNFLTPVFTLGVCNLQIYQGEEEPTRDQLILFFETLSDESKILFQKSGGHETALWNWRLTKKGLRLIDYAVDSLDTNWALFILTCEFKSTPKPLAP